MESLQDTLPPQSNQGRSNGRSAGRRAEERKRVGDRKVKWILLRHPLPEEPHPPPQCYTLSYPGLKSQATPRLRNSPKRGGGVELQDL